MKVVNTIVKILAALAAVAGVIYVIATYGDKIVAWAKNLLSRTCECDCCCEDEDCCCEEGEECCCQCCEDEMGEEAAEEADFEG